VDTVPLTRALESFDAHGLRAQNDKLLDVPDMATVLRSFYEKSERINLPLAIDLAINWLLNVYDSQRTGQVRVLAFKVSVVLLCNGHLEEKYRCKCILMLCSILNPRFQTQTINATGRSKHKNWDAKSSKPINFLYKKINLIL